MSAHDIPDSVTVDGEALDDAVRLLALMEDFLLFREEEGEALVRFYGSPTTAESLANFVGSTGAYLRRRLEGFPS